MPDYQGLGGKVKTAIAGAGVAAMLVVSACSSDADVASSNLSKAADQFEVNRRIIFYNGITDRYMLSIEGLCSIEKDNVDSQLEVTCKVGEESFKKHFLGISDNVTYFVEQLEPSNVSVHHYRVVFKPQSILPDIDFSGDAGELGNQTRPAEPTTTSP
jgi:hypothetical protein